MKGNTERQKVLSILPFWGKASATSQGGPGFHPIVYHSLDVAAVGATLIARDRERLKRIAAAVGIGVDPFSDALPFFLALHDIGKYSRVFQAKSPDHWPAGSLGPYRAIPPGNSHVITGFQLLLEVSDNGSCRDVFEIIERGDFARCMPRQRNADFLRLDSDAIVAHADQSAAAALEFHVDAMRPRVQGIFNQLLDHGRRPLDDLAGGDLIDEFIG